MSFPCSPPILLSGGNTGLTGAPEGPRQPGGTLGPFLPLPSKPPPTARRRPCPSGSLRASASAPLASAGLPRAAFLFAPHSTADAAVAPPHPPAPHGYPGEKARLLAPAPLRSCRNFGCETWKRRTYGHAAGVAPAPLLPRGPCGGPGGRRPPTERAAEGTGTVEETHGTDCRHPPARGRASGWAHVTSHVPAQLGRGWKPLLCFASSSPAPALVNFCGRCISLPLGCLIA